MLFERKLADFIFVHWVNLASYVLPDLVEVLV